MKKIKVLIIEDEPTVSLGISCTLEDAGYTVACAEDGFAGLALYKEQAFDIVITDLRLPGLDGIEILKSIKAISSDTGVIVMTAFADVKTAVEAMREGAYDYISKPFEAEELLIVIERFLSYKNIENENIRLKQELKEGKRFQRIVGASPVMKKVFETIATVAKTDSSVIIYGESGTGKELVADAIHNLSPRKNEPLIKLNCAAIPEALFESELFGHEKGAFTGADKRRRGKFEMADGGAILLDEIGEMPYSVQAKLLRVLEDHCIERVGGNEIISIDVRTIFATKQNLLETVKSGNFREDLYYRINVLPIVLPPLRERKEDIPLLIDYFIQMFCEKMEKNQLALSPESLEALTAYNYPGNVRELMHAVEMAVIFCRSEEIESVCLPAEMRNFEEDQSAIRSNCENLLLSDRIKEFEKETIAKALIATGYKKLKAAQKLGISRETLWRKLKEHNISVPDNEAGIH